MILRFFLVLAAVIAVDASLLILFLSNPSPATVPVVIAAGIGMVPIVGLLAFHMLWRPIFDRYPWQRPSLDASRRRFQSFSVSVVNMGFSIHASIDEEFLHLEPLWLWQVLGASPASIPWSAMTAERRGAPLAGAGRAVRLDGHLIVGPRWCFERVFKRDEPEAQDDPDDRRRSSRHTAI